MKSSQKFQIRHSTGAVSAILEIPVEVRAGLTLAHGAGAGMYHPFMTKLAGALKSAGFAVLRFQFPYMEKGLKRTDSPKVAIETVEAAVTALRKYVTAPIFAGGKSFGGRMTTTAAAEGILTDLSGILCFGFPLHPAGKPSRDRAIHLERVKTPILFLQGTRDELADLELMRSVCADLPDATLRIIDGADHSFGVLKRSGRTEEQVMNEIVKESGIFLQKVLKG